MFVALGYLSRPSADSVGDITDTIPTTTVQFQCIHLMDQTLDRTDFHNYIHPLPPGASCEAKIMMAGRGEYASYALLGPCPGFCQSF